MVSSFGEISLWVVLPVYKTGFEENSNLSLLSKKLDNALQFMQNE